MDRDMTANTESERKTESMSTMVSVGLKVPIELLDNVRENNLALKHASVADILRAGIAGLIGMSIDQALETYNHDRRRNRTVETTKTNQESDSDRSDTSAV